MLLGCCDQARDCCNHGMRSRSFTPTFSIWMLQVLVHQPRVVLAAAAAFLDPLARELAGLDLAQHLLHLALGGLVHDARTARQVAVLRRLADEAMHLRQAAFVQQVDDELELVQTLVIRDLGLITGLDQRLEAFHDQLGRPAAQHDLFAEQIRLGFLGEGRGEHAAARAADAVRIGERIALRTTGRVLADRHETRHAAALLVLAAHEVAWTFRCDQHDIEILARLDLLEVDVEAVCEQDRRAFADGADHFLVQVFLRHVRGQKRDQRRAVDRVDGLGHLQSILLRFRPAGARPADADDDVETAVLQIECMCSALTAVAENGDASALEGLLVDVLLRVDLHVRSRRLLKSCSAGPMCAFATHQRPAMGRRGGKARPENRRGSHHMAAELVKLRYAACLQRFHVSTQHAPR